MQKIVRNAVAGGIHVRVVGTAHSSNSQLCTDGVVISTERLNHILGIENLEGEETVLVEPGASMSELSEWLARHGKALGYGFVGFRGISVGGVVATAAHGSSALHSPILATGIKGLIIVTGDGNLREFSEKTTDEDTFKALRAHLGMLGAVVQMRIAIRPQFNLDTRVTFESEKEILDGKNAVDLIRSCDFGQIHWFPRAKKIMKTCGKETSKVADPGATNIYLDPFIPKKLIQPYKVAFHLGACSKAFNSLLEKFRFAITKLHPPFKKENIFGHSFNSRHVIGPSHRMLSSELGLGKETLIVRDWEVAIPESEVPAAIEEIHQYLSENNMALPITGVYLRFAPVEGKTLLSAAVAGEYFHPGEVATYIEFPSYHPVGFSLEGQEEYDRQYETIFKKLLEKHHGRVHWGKNQKSIFELQKELGTYEENLTRFRKVLHQLDPTQVFLNDFGRNFIDKSNSGAAALD